MSNEIKNSGMEDALKAVQALGTLLEMRERMKSRIQDSEKHRKSIENTPEMKEYDAIIEWSVGTQEEMDAAGDDWNDCEAWKKKHPDLPPLPADDLFKGQAFQVQMVHMCRYYFLEKGLVAQ